MNQCRWRAHHPNDGQAEQFGERCSEQIGAALLGSLGVPPPPQDCQGSEEETRPYLLWPDHSLGFCGMNKFFLSSWGMVKGQGAGGMGRQRSQDTLVINAAQGEAGVGESGKAIPVQPGPKRDVLHPGGKGGTSR